MRKFANEYQSSKKREKKSIDGTRGHTSKRTKNTTMNMHKQGLVCIL